MYTNVVAPKQRVPNISPHSQLQAAAGRGSARCHSARPLQRCWAAATSPRPSDERRHPSPPRACPARTLQVGKPGIPKRSYNVGPPSYKLVYKPH